MNDFRNGVWPTMLTPFTKENKVDYGALCALTDWYIENGVSGIFAVCQSSEMHFLTLEERSRMAAEVVKRAAGRVGVIASGHISDSFEKQLEELKAAAASGADAVVMVTNRFAAPDESEEVWKKNASRMLDSLPGVTFGLYECPKPYKRVMSAQLLGWCASTGRFAFLKDTCCDMPQINAKLDVIKGRSMKLFNANTATLLESLRAGCSGFCGVMANFHPDLYAWLCGNWRTEPAKAEAIQAFLTVCSLCELQLYPTNAKYYLNKFYGLPFTLICRSADYTKWNELRGLETDAIYRMTCEVCEKYGVEKCIR